MTSIVLDDEIDEVFADELFFCGEDEGVVVLDIVSVIAVVVLVQVRVLDSTVVDSIKIKS